MTRRGKTRWPAGVAAGVLALVLPSTLGFINPRLTPVHLANQSEIIFVATVRRTANPDRWLLETREHLKGTADMPRRVGVVRWGLSPLPPVPFFTLDLSNCAEDDRENVRKILVGRAFLPAHSGAGQECPAYPGVLFAAKDADVTHGYLHAGDQWMRVKSRDRVNWQVESLATSMNGTYAGGTDMLIRMTRYILSDPDADSPVSVGVGWMQNRCELGQVVGNITGMAAVRLTADGPVHLFVASDAGDRLFRAKTNDEVFEDVTDATKLTSRSRRFTWIDPFDRLRAGLNAGADTSGLDPFDRLPSGPRVLGTRGRAGLVSWDGATVGVWEAAKDGTFRAPTPTQRFRLDGDCLGLTPCRPAVAASAAMAESAPAADGSSAVLVSTRGLPFILHPDARDGKWVRTDLPGKAPDGECPCVVADFDGDGYPDVLRPGPERGLLWRGKSDGFRDPETSAVTCPPGPTRFTLGDFNQDGLLDVFLAGSAKIELWENDGKGVFRAVSDAAGTLSYKAPAGLSDCVAADLNHDGRTDLCLLYASGNFAYHFNRGFRCFGEEGELQLFDPKKPLEPAGGQQASAVADFNGDGSLDLAVAFTDGRVSTYYNVLFNRPMLRLGLRKDLPGPLSVSVWQGTRYPLCVGTFPVCGSTQEVVFTLRSRDEFTIRWSQPGRADRSVTLRKDIPEEGLELTLGEEKP